MSEKKWVYLFHEIEQAIDYVGGNWDDARGLLGGKGANLADMTRIGVPVPPGFTATTEACNAYQPKKEFPEGLWEQMLAAMKDVEKETGKVFGGVDNPLLVSCRSGAKFSMPGMMDTVLNIGLNDDTAQAMIKLTGNERFVYDSYRRLIQMFGSVVLDITDEAFEHVFDGYKEKNAIKADTDLSTEDLKYLTEQFKIVVRKEKGFDFPQDAYQQLKLATEAVFKSWMGKRAVDYRRATDIPDDLGTAVNICTMVFGNMGWDSGTGVAFTRNPATGESKLYGDYLLNAQGEDVVAGIRNTDPIQKMGETMPAVYQQFLDIVAKLEKHYKDMQDVEFTIERGRLWMLQTRNGKRTARAAVKVAVDMVEEGLIDKKTAVSRVTSDNVDTLLHPQFDAVTKKVAMDAGRFFCSGVNASPGAAVGQIYFDADTTERMAKEEHQETIMVRPFTKPDDVHGMLAAQGILTSEGGATSHAAVVARQFGVPCIVGASSVKIDLDRRVMTSGDIVVKEGEWISVDGTTGEVFLGKVDKHAPSLDEQTELLKLLDWADEICATPGIRKGDTPGFPTVGLQVWANADYPKDAIRAREYGAKGIGLCRTEHMFFEPERLPSVQRMILAKTSEDRVDALNDLLPSQRSDFEGLFEAMDGLPVIIRLIDPPLHEFLPAAEELRDQIITKRVAQMADYILGKGESKEIVELEKLLAAVESMHESNPMMGMRGVRLSIMMPEIVEMQVRAIMEAAANNANRGLHPKPEVMIPLTGHINELKVIQPRLEAIAKEVMEAKKVHFEYKFGTMIEIPRAAVTAAEIAGDAEFFSFGTNDLTQMTFGYSRDDAERSFLLKYVEDGILPKNPFQTIDRDGVGGLMKMAVENGRATRPSLEVGICGEHGGDPNSIEFCHMIGQNYVSCSPFRVPVARLAAAHAALKYAPK
ncbi:MAG: pyruvate, phosphate dikinase [Chloroflexi bacterium HGW-Chloroflexi-10]|nr:MAG: pyruvate, phosphate dikinase [Chloroflexi bacterium HGW-Chloroflexi-10]